MKGSAGFVPQALALALRNEAHTAEEPVGGHDAADILGEALDEMEPVEHNHDTFDPEIEGHEEHGEAQVVMLFLFSALLVGCASRFMLEWLRKKFKIRIPYSVVLLIIGGLCGYATWDKVQSSAHDESDEAFTRSLHIWSGIDAHLLLFIFLPALIYEGSSETNYYVFTQHFFSAIILAFPGMLFQAFLIACLGRYMLPYGWAWTESVLFGAILSATDPVAVVALLKELGVLPDLRVLIEAESLLNDGTAIVLFQLCITILTEPGEVSEYIGLGFRMVLGSPTLGLAMFIGSYIWLSHTRNALEETVVTVCTAYLGFYVAEGTEVEMSGVLTVVTIGVLMAGLGHTAIDNVKSMKMLHSVWSMIVFCADTTIFILAGAIIVEKWLSTTDVITGPDWGIMVGLYFLLNVIRGVMVGVFSPCFRAWGYGLQPRVCSLSKFTRSMAVVTWGGLRGAVGLALALAVAADDDLRSKVSDKKYNDRVLLLTAAMVVLTTVVNAALMENVISWLGLGEVSESQVKLFKAAVRYLGDKHEQFIEQLQNSQENPEFSAVDWQLLRRYIGPDQMFGPKSEVWEELQQWERAARGAESTRGIESNRELPDEEEEMQSELQERMGRFLASLRASYTSQWNRGLLAAGPFRKLRWAVDMALDHMNDQNSQSDGTHSRRTDGEELEWGWLMTQGYMEVPWYVRWVKSTPGFRALGEQLELWEKRQHFEMVCAVLRAHEETTRCEFTESLEESGQGGNRVQQRMFEMSDAIRGRAQKRLADLEGADGKNEMGKAVRTRQACCVLLSKLDMQLDELLHIAQITPAEHEVLHNVVVTRLERSRTQYPTWPRRAKYEQHVMRSIPMFGGIPEDEMKAAIDELVMEELSFIEGDVIYETNSPFNKVFIVMSGIVESTSQFDDMELEVDINMEVFLLEPGALFGEVEFLLFHAGVPKDQLAAKSPTARAKSTVTVYAIELESLSTLAEKSPSCLQTIWRHSGLVVEQIYSELMVDSSRNAPSVSAALAWEFATLLPVGAQPGDQQSLLVRGAATLLDGSTISAPPFTIISRRDSRQLKPGPEAVFIVFPEPKVSIVERRSVEMQRGNMVPLVGPQAGGAARRGGSLDMARPAAARGMSLELARLSGSGGAALAPNQPWTGASFRSSRQMLRQGRGNSMDMPDDGARGKGHMIEMTPTQRRLPIRLASSAKANAADPNLDSAARNKSNTSTDADSDDFPDHKNGKKPTSENQGNFSPKLPAGGSSPMASRDLGRAPMEQHASSGEARGKAAQILKPMEPASPAVVLPVQVEEQSNASEEEEESGIEAVGPIQALNGDDSSGDEGGELVKMDSTMEVEELGTLAAGKKGRTDGGGSGEDSATNPDSALP
mmetsp:Transcript_54586/g.127608  ORF Transcript_54586/g.127608 Transcript_54586/m.127608 type:complete len:1367 (-) Transcript_54586:382-4482(-)